MDDGSRDFIPIYYVHGVFNFNYDDPRIYNDYDRLFYGDMPSEAECTTMSRIRLYSDYWITNIIFSILVNFTNFINLGMITLV